MSSVFTYKRRTKWFSILLILFFVGHGVLGQANINEKSATKKKLMKHLAMQENNRQLIICCPELAIELDPYISVETWMVEENFGLDIQMFEPEPPIKQWMISNKTWNSEYSGKLVKDSSELKTMNYIKHK